MNITIYMYMHVYENVHYQLLDLRNNNNTKEKKAKCKIVKASIKLLQPLGFRKINSLACTCIHNVVNILLPGSVSTLFQTGHTRGSNLS